MTKRRHERLDRQTKARIDRALFALRIDPYRTGDVKRLSGDFERYLRLRIGGWRIIFRVDEERHCVLIYDVAPRGGAYH